MVEHKLNKLILSIIINSVRFCCAYEKLTSAYMQALFSCILFDFHEVLAKNNADK